MKKENAKLPNFIFEVFKHQPKLTFWSFLEALFLILQSYVPLLILVFIIQSFVNGDISATIAWVALYFGASSIFSWLSLYSKNKRVYLAIKLNNEMITDIYLKATNIEYSDYLDDSFRKLYLTALDELYYECDYSDIIDVSINNLVSIGKILVSFSLIISLVFSKPSEINGIIDYLANPIVSLFFSIFILGIALFIVVFSTKKINEKQKKLFPLHANIERVFSYINEKIVYNFKNYATFQTYAMKPMLGKMMEENSNENRKYFGDMRELGIKKVSINNFAFGIVTFYAYFLAAIKVNTGAINASLFLSYAQSILLIGKSIFDLSSGLLQIQRQHPYFENLVKFMKVKEVVTPKQIIIEGPIEVTFDNVSYRYPNSLINAVSNLSFTISSNILNVIVGENGSGKTTMVLLMLGLLKPAEGTIKVNNQDISKINIKDYWKEISCVFQDHSILPLSLGENISATSNYDEERICNDLKNLNFDIVEKGYNLSKDIFTDLLLSGGEKQKVAVARGKYRDSKIFVLDEPTSAMDAISEKNLFESMLNLIKGRFGLIVTHRLSVCKNSDNIIVMKSGKVQNIGTHYELLKSCIEYERLWTLQSKYYQ